MRGSTIALLVVTLLLAGSRSLIGQTVPPPTDTRHSLLREAMLGLLANQASVPDTATHSRCVPLPADPPNDRLLGPHGDSLLVARCEVVTYTALPRPPGGPWSTAEYHWTSVFTAEDTSRGPAARDTATESEVVLFAPAEPGQLRPIWHARFDASDYAVWRSITPAIAAPDSATTLLSVMFCVNGTGGCSQEFLRRSPQGPWRPVWQVWLDQLPPGYTGRIRHGTEIDPQTLKAETGFYGDQDPNCCPSQLLRAQLALQGDSLVLRRHRLVPLPPSQ